MISHCLVQYPHWRSTCLVLLQTHLDRACIATASPLHPRLSWACIFKSDADIVPYLGYWKKASNWKRNENDGRRKLQARFWTNVREPCPGRVQSLSVLPSRDREHIVGNTRSSALPNGHSSVTRRALPLFMYAVPPPHTAVVEASRTLRRRHKRRHTPKPKRRHRRKRGHGIHEVDRGHVRMLTRIRWVTLGDPLQTKQAGAILGASL